MIYGIHLIRANRGLMSWLAPRLGIHVSTISGWRQVPPERVHEIERLTGLPRYWIRPDLWAPPWGSEEGWFRLHGNGGLPPGEA